MKITELLNRLNQELDQVEAAVSKGHELIQPALSLAPENTLLIQIYAYLNTMAFFTEDSRRRIKQATELLEQNDIPPEESRNLGEDLSELLGRVLEAKISIDRIISRWEI